MPKAIQLQIPKPCHENWNAMSPNEQGRFCGSCQKTVVDFSTMTDKEIVNYFSTASHHVCGRFSGDQLNKDLRLTEKKTRFSFAYLWNFLLATFLVTEATAQVKPAKKVHTVKQYTKSRMLMGDTIIAEPPPTLLGEIAVIEPPDPVPQIDITGTVTDEGSTGPLRGVTVMIKGTDRGTITDSLGNFHLTVEKKNSVILVISTPGFATQTMAINENRNCSNLRVYLKQSTDALMGDVIIVNKPSGKRKKSH